MSDIVTLNGYKIKDEKAVRSYETVALMKADTKLKEGYHVKTKGYYEANDGGHGEYIIVDDETLVDDGGSIHVLTNGLRAKLIIDDVINVKQFGAYGDGIHDDTQAIQNAGDFCEKFNNAFQDTKVLYFTTGEYLTSDTIHLSIACRVRFTGNVAIITSVIDKSCIKIDTKDLITPSTGYLFQQMNAYEEGALIDGDGILVLQHTGSYFNDLTTNCIGLELGDTTNRNLTPSISVSRSYINNIHISGFNVALKLNKYHLYMMTFDNMILSKNTINIKYGDSDALNTGNDIGEKITFNNSLFTVSYCAIELNTLGHFYFNNCSLDFNGCVFRLNSKQLTNINVVGGHIEGIGNIGRGMNVTPENTIGYGQVMCIPESTAGTGACYNVNFIGTAFHLSSSIDLTYPLFKSATAWNQYSTDLNINLVNCSGFTYQSPSGLTNDVFMSDGNVKIHKLENASTGTRMMHNKNTDYSGLFSTIDNSLTGTNADSDSSYTTLKGKGFRINGTNYGDSTPFSFSIDTTKKLFEKSIKIDISSFDYPSVDRIIPCKKNNIINCAWFKLNELNPRPDTNIIHHFIINTRYIFYTKDDEEITSTTLVSTTINISDLDNGYGRTVISKIRCPIDADYCVIKNTVSAYQSNNSLTRIDGSLYWCGTLVNYED